MSGESPRLQTDSLEDRLEALQRKQARTKDKQTIGSADSTYSESVAEDYSADATKSTDSDPDAPSEQALLDAIKDLARQLEKAPTATEMKEQGRFGPHQYYDAFGKWDEALAQTDLNTQADLTADLRRVADKLDSRPTTGDMDEHGRYNGHWYNRYFETWEDALEAAGIETPTEEDLLAEIQRLDRKHARIPSPKLMRDDGKYPPKLSRDHFGSWDDAIDAAGIDKRHRLIDELKRVNAECDGRPTTTVANDISIYSSSYFSNEFGSWGDALEAAGISDQAQNSKSVNNSNNSVDTTDDSDADTERPSDEGLIEELRRLDRDMTGTPTGNTMMNEGKYNTSLYYMRFGGWDEALEAAGIGSDDGSDRMSTTSGSDTSQEPEQDPIQSNELAELYESLRVLNKVLVKYLESKSGIHLDDDQPVAIWQSVIEDVAVGDGISTDVPCLGKLHADQNPFSMNEYREQYGDGDLVTDFQALEVAPIGRKEYSQLVGTTHTSLPKPQLPIVPDSGRPLSTLLSQGADLTEAVTQLEELLTTVLDIDTIAPPNLSTTEPEPTSTAGSTATPTAGTSPSSDSETLTLSDIEPDEIYEGPLVGRLTGYIANPSGDISSQLHLTDITGEDFWLYILDQSVDHEWKRDNWYFISQFDGPKEPGGGRGEQALRSTPQLSVEDHGTSLPPTIDADVEDPSDSQTQSSATTQTASTASNSNGQTATSSGGCQTATSSKTSSSGDGQSDSEPDEETDPMVDDLLEDMEDNDLL